MFNRGPCFDHWFARVGSLFPRLLIGLFADTFNLFKIFEHEILCQVNFIFFIHSSLFLARFFLHFLYFPVDQDQAPIECIVVDVYIWVVGCLHDKLLQVSEVSQLIKRHRSHVVHVMLELLWAAFAQFRVRGCFLDSSNLHLSHQSVLRGYKLPGQAALEQSNDNVTQCDQIIATRQLIALMRIGWDVSARAYQALTLAEWDMVARFRVDHWACQAEIDQKDSVRGWT